MDKKQQIIHTVNRSWLKDLIIRHLYVKLAPYFQRDLNFFFASEEVQYQMFISDKIELPNVICSSLCKYYKNLYEQYSIDCIIITTNQKLVPHHALLVKGEIGWYFIDPLKDLMANQVGIKPNFYGIIYSRKYFNLKEQYPYITTLPKEYVEELDSFLKLYPEAIYLNDILNILHSELTTNKSYISLNQYFHSSLQAKDKQEITEAKIKFMNNHLVNYASIPGKMERTQFYDYILTRILNHTENKHANIICQKEGPIILRCNGYLYEEMQEVTGKRYFKRKTTNDHNSN